MPVYVYRARNEKGELVSGQLEAEDAGSVKKMLFEQGLIPLSARAGSLGGLTLASINQLFIHVKAEEMIVFTRQFYTLFKAGVSIDIILRTLSKQIRNKPLQEAVEQVQKDVAGGSSLSQAFAKHPRVFNELYVSMIQAGEDAGILEHTLNELTRLIEKEDEIKRSVKSATLYPKIVIGVLLLSVFALMTIVVPKFTQFYTHYGSDLPTPTQIMITTSNFMRSYWYVLLLAGGVMMWLYNRYYSTKSGRFAIDTLRFKLPVFGFLLTKICNARFSHILSALYRSGFPMPRALDVAARVIGNEAFALQVLHIRDSIQKGSSLADAMSREELFPPIMIETTAVGERTGALDDMLQALATHYDLEVSHTIKNLTTLLEPVLLIFIFGMVTTLALSIFLPIWQMSSIVSR